MKSFHLSVKGTNSIVLVMLSIRWQYRLVGTVDGIWEKERGILDNILCMAIRLIWTTGFRTRYSTSVQLYRAVSKIALAVLFRSSSSPLGIAKMQFRKSQTWSGRVVSCIFY